MGMFTWFWKMLGNLGKRVYYNRETKVSMYLYGAMHQTMIETMADTQDGNFEQAMDVLIDLVKPLSEEIISDMLFETSVMGVQLKNLIKKFRAPKDFRFFEDMALYSVFGKWYKKIFANTIYIPPERSEQGVHTYIMRLKKCPFCYTTMIPPEKFGAHRFNKVLTLTVEQMLQLSQDFLENDYHIVAREVKCFHQGDPYGEVQAWMYPRDQLELMDKNPYLKQIK